MFENIFNKKYNLITYSGTLAIETALRLMGIKEGDKIIIPNNICYKVLMTILSMKAVPILVNPKNQFVLCADDIKVAMKDYKIKCIILVHLYGLPVNVKEVRKQCGNDIKIIEDVAQAWDIYSYDYTFGKYSDYIVSSLGKTKPLSFGIGGVIALNENPYKCVGTGDLYQREEDKILTYYLIPCSFKLNIKKISRKASNIVKFQRKIAKIIVNNLKRCKIEVCIDIDIYQASWNRIPILIKDINKYNIFIKTLSKSKVQYELPHEKYLQELNILKNIQSYYINNNVSEEKLILIKPRYCKRLEVNRWLKKLNKLM